MEAYSYVNIFETKGIEYLLVIAFLIGFILFVRALKPRLPLATDTRAESPSAPTPICLARQACPHRKAFEGARRLAVVSGVNRDGGSLPHLCTCPDLELVEGQGQLRAG